MHTNLRHEGFIGHLIVVIVMHWAWRPVSHLSWCNFQAAAFPAQEASQANCLHKLF